MTFFKSLFPYICSFSLFLSALGAAEFESYWFTITFPDDWTLYETTRYQRHNHTGIGSQHVFKKGVIGVEASSSWDQSLNVEFLRQSLHQPNAQKKIKKHIFRKMQYHFAHFKFTKFSSVIVSGIPCFEVEWNAVSKKKNRFKAKRGQKLYFSECFIPSLHDMGNYSIICYASKWNEPIKKELFSIRDSFHR